MSQIPLSVDGFKRQATRLQEFLGEFLGEKFKRAQALEAVARMHGYPNYNTALAVLERAEAQPPFAVRPALLPVLEADALKLLSQRMRAGVHRIDDQAMSAIRTLWNDIGPTNSCVDVGRLMLSIEAAAMKAHLDRRNFALDTILEFRGEFRLVGDALTAGVRALVEKHYPNELYFELIRKTGDVYRRKGALAHKYQDTSFDYRMGLLRVGSLNMRARALQAVETELKQWRLSTLRDDVAQRAITVVYTTEARLDRTGGAVGQQYEVDFLSVDAAKKTPIPEWASFAMIREDGGVHTWSHVHGWEFQRTQSQVN